MEATARQQQLNLVGGVCVLSVVLYLILGQLMTSNLEVSFFPSRDTWQLCIG